MATKGMLARYKKMSAGKSQQLASMRKTAKQYAPSVTNSLVTAGGGFAAGAVMSGQYIPAEIAGISTPLLLGGVLASYGIFASGQGGQQAMIGNICTNLGDGMISAWAALYALEMHAKAAPTQNTSTVG
tara:strand:- start:2601 stop:2987 length:387 start_codon:yes stop_codon:yes gene_type:complete